MTHTLEDHLHTLLHLYIASNWDTQGIYTSYIKTSSCLGITCQRTVPFT